ncbi:MAG: MCE family protein, partial [Dietzia sp.]
MHKKLPYWLVALLLVVVVAVVAVTYLAVTRLGRTTITATFPSAVGVSEGTDVRILGVTVGSVEEVTPMGDTVEVRLYVNRGVDVPADAKAVQVTPSVIPDRNIQLVPAYSGGPTMESGAHIPIERTATPVEVDRLYASVRDLTEALGPDGANRDGALDRFVTTSADTLADNGAALGRSIDELSRAATTLADSSQDISETVINLQSFVTMLAENDAQVREFNSQMASFNQTVAGQREDLQGALGELSYALADVARLVRDNQDVIRSNADRLVTLSQITADQRDDLEEILKTAPLALANLINAYDAESGTLSMRPNIPEKQNP